MISSKIDGISVRHLATARQKNTLFAIACGLDDSMAIGS